METFVMAMQLLLSLSILVVLHELGHFIPAKIFKTRVEKFYLFFNPWFSLFKFKKGETEYGIGWLPLGGYVKISGMIDESMDTEQMKKEPQPWEFRSKPAWQRLIIMIGGVTVNILLAFFIYSMITFAWGKNRIKNEDLKNGLVVHEMFKELGFQNGDKILKIDGEKTFSALNISKHMFLRDVKEVEVIHSDGETEIISIPDGIEYKMFKNRAAGNSFTPRFLLPEIGSVTEKGNAEKSGLKKGDKILSINKQGFTYFDELKNSFSTQKGKEVSISFLRNKDTLLANVMVDTNGRIGFFANLDNQETKISNKKYSLSESIPLGISEGYWTLHDYVVQMKFLFTKQGAGQLGGFGTIAKIFPTEWNWRIFWNRTAFLSVILAFMNILPIPALDGGHVLFLLYEMISGKAPNDKFLEKAQMIGILLLLSLMLYANGADAVRAFTK